MGYFKKTSKHKKRKNKILVLLFPLLQACPIFPVTEPEPLPTINGTEGDDELGDPTSEIRREINGLGGNDIIYGGTKGDSIYAGAGDDTIYPGKGSDGINGEEVLIRLVMSIQSKQSM